MNLHLHFISCPNDQESKTEANILTVVHFYDKQLIQINDLKYITLNK